jgi:hypothetical protein
MTPAGPDDPIAQPSLPAAFLARVGRSPDRVALRACGSDARLTPREWGDRARAVAGTTCARWSTPRAPRVLDHDWPPGGAFVTPTSKVRRGVVRDHYRQVIEELYAR